MKTKLILSLILLLGIILRLIYFKGPTTFFYDQGRDAIASLEIWQSDPIKILGPQTDTPGLFHGPLYWYIISPFYYFSNGNVWVVRFFLILINCLTILVIYKLSESLFKNKKVSLLASFLFAISFEAVQYARWLSNPTPAILTITLSFWSLVELINGKKWALVSLFFFWGLSMQFQLFLLYQSVVFLIIWLINKGFTFPKATIKIYLVAFLSFLATTLSFIAAEVKFKFQGSKALLSFLVERSGPSNITPKIKDFMENLNIVIQNNIVGANGLYATIFLFLLIFLGLVAFKKDKIKKELLTLYILLLSPLIVYLLNGPNAYFLNMGMLIPLIILTSYFLVKYFDKYKLLVFLIFLSIIYGNISQIITKNKEGETLFTVQKQMILRDELKVIDWIYQESEGKPFKLNTITAPLFINTTWAYLFNWYGLDKYGYMPFWWGETQVDVPGSKIKFADSSDSNMHFVIIEPKSSDDKSYINAILSLEDTRSKVIKTEKIGYFTVEKREITTPRIFTIQDVFYLVMENQ